MRCHPRCFHLVVELPCKEQSPLTIVKGFALYIPSEVSRGALPQREHGKGRKKHLGAHVGAADRVLIGSRGE